MLKRQGFLINKKRVYRIAKTLRLLVQKKKRRKRLFVSETKEFPMPNKVNQVWAMDFVSDRLENGSVYRCFTIVDLYTRECPVIHTSFSMKEKLPVRILNELKLRGQKPEAIILDNGPEFKNHTMFLWCKLNNVSLHFIDPGEPVQNAYIESFNGKFRDECLNAKSFTNIFSARNYIYNWVKHYNNERPHSSLDYKTPKEFAEQESIVLEEQITKTPLVSWY